MSEGADAHISPGSDTRLSIEAAGVDVENAGSYVRSSWSPGTCTVTSPLGVSGITDVRGHFETHRSSGTSSLVQRLNSDAFHKCLAFGLLGCPPLSLTVCGRLDHCCAHG